jgi:hypothetical protein
MSDVEGTQVRSSRTARATTGRMRAEARFIGFVTRKIWRYDNQLRFRLAVPMQPSDVIGNDTRLNFYTIVVPATLSRGIRLQAGALVNVVAVPLSREYDETLERFLRFAQNAPVVENAAQVTQRRVRTEFVAVALTIENRRSTDEVSAAIVEAREAEDTNATALD